jgi:hypothetical protein
MEIQLAPITLPDLVSVLEAQIIPSSFFEALPNKYSPLTEDPLALMDTLQKSNAL